MSSPFAELRRMVADVESFTGPDIARGVLATLTRAEEALAAWWNAPLGWREAAAWGGYSESQLRKLVKDGTIPVATNGRIRRRDVPVHAGHKLPLGLEVEPVASPDWAEDLRERRQPRSAHS
jgi:hypothetical protein